MYIKYLGEIHNVENYYSVIRSGGTKHNVIQLTKENASYEALEFKDDKSRDFALSEIWEKLTEGIKFFDLDEVINLYYITNKYNI
jgi:hypothetical protein